MCNRHACILEYQVHAWLKWTCSLLSCWHIFEKFVTFFSVVLPNCVICTDLVNIYIDFLLMATSAQKIHTLEAFICHRSRNQLIRFHHVHCIENCSGPQKRQQCCLMTSVQSFVSVLADMTLTWSNRLDWFSIILLVF